MFSRFLPPPLRARFERRRLDEGGRVAILGVAAKIISSERLAAMLDQMVDRRFLIEELARTKGISVEAVLEELARRGGIQAVREVPPADVATVAQTGRTLAEFRSAGAIPVTEGERVIGIVCVDPMTVRTMLGFANAVPYYLAPWSAISKALDLSVQRYAERERQTHADRVEKLRQLARYALEALLKEVHSYSRNAVNILFEGVGVTYEFTTGDGKRARGTIHHSISEQLEEILMRAVIEGGLTIARPQADSSQAAPEYVTVRGDRSCFRLLWGIEVEASAPRDRTLKLVDTARPDTDERTVVPQVVDQSITAVSPESSTHSIEGSILLIIDDNETFGRVLERFFERHGCTTVYVSSAVRALEMLRSMNPLPHAVVCDVHMPEMTGIDLVKKLRSQEATKGMPVVMLTSDDEAETEISLMSCGADAFVAKSEDPRVLWVHVRRLLEKLASRRAA